MRNFHIVAFEGLLKSVSQQGDVKVLNRSASAINSWEPDSFKTTYPHDLLVLSVRFHKMFRFMMPPIYTLSFHFIYNTKS